ncbi:unnamed protein product, partial [Gulo gulo]
AREQLPQPRSRLLLLLPAVRAPGRQGHRAQQARRLMVPAGRCRSPPFPAARCVPYVRPRTSRRPPASQTSTPAPSVTARSAT